MTERYKDSFHVNGVGGKGMGPLAGLLKLAGFSVTGDDLLENERTVALKSAGVEIDIGENTCGPAGTNILVTGISQMKEKAKQKKILMLDRLKVVDKVFKEKNKKQLCVTGSFGKSSASGFLFAALKASNPSCYIGAALENTTAGAHIGSGDYAVVEACEYRDAYFDLSPWLILHLNTFQNHEDFFGPGARVFQESICRFVEKSSSTLRHIVIVEGEHQPRNFSKVSNTEVHIVGRSSNSKWRLRNIEKSANGSSFNLVEEIKGVESGPFVAPIFGDTVIDATAGAVVSAMLCGLSEAEIKNGIINARLSERRLKTVHESGSIVCIDDNARHAIQLRVLISSVRQKFPGRKCCFVVSPWGRKNRRDLEQWSQALSGADFVIILPLGDASVELGGAEPIESPETLSKLLAEKGTEVKLAANPMEASEFIVEKMKSVGNIVVSSVGYDSFRGDFEKLYSSILNR